MVWDGLGLGRTFSLLRALEWALLYPRQSVCVCVYRCVHVCAHVCGPCMCVYACVSVFWGGEGSPRGRLR